MYPVQLVMYSDLAVSYRTESIVVRFPVEVNRYVSSPKPPESSGIRPVFCSMSTGDPTLGIKRPWRGADNFTII